ncbi:hypothetical protein [Tychonema sp. LEGE 07203]|uniref:hypothetical protein n=1 Tax=Tychonema sp. LEGE 07203 TaxID=1828671 RepID=UPI001880D0EC|nr:hypothetical protein [Tychonema sp. LEGE 07203]MBE9093555.1 hypothetical protein [Tychonema sp. LEGE 07203]
MFTSLTETNPASEYPNAPSKSFVFNDSSDAGGYFVSEILVALALIFVKFSRCNGIEKVTSALPKYTSIFGEIDKFWTISSNTSDYLEPCKSQLPTLQKILAHEETGFFHRICRCPASILVKLPIDNSGFASFYADRDTDTLSNGSAGDRLFADKESHVIEGVERAKGNKVECNSHQPKFSSG